MKTSLKFSFALFVVWGLVGLMNATAQDCIDARKIQPDKNCVRSFDDPVCGCDGKTYASSCVAERNGVTKWKPGTCPGTVEESFTKFGRDWQAAYNASDSRALHGMYAKDAVQYVSDGNVLEGAAKIAEYYQKMFENQPKSETNIKTNDVVQLCENWVSSSGTFVTEALQVPGQGPDHPSHISKGSYVILAQQVDGEWKIVRHHVYMDLGRAPGKIKVMEKAKMKAPARN